MQVFRFFGLPDRVLAFDELPERMLEGFEMIKAAGFPRHWKEWMGTKKKIIRLPPEIDPFTKQVRRYEPIEEVESFFYLVDANLGQVMERWAEVEDFVRQHVSKDFRLKDKLQDMALPLSPDKTSSVDLEPEAVVVIPIPLEFQEKGQKLVSPAGTELKKNVPSETFSCVAEGCKSSFDTKAGLRMHAMKKHSKESVAA